jgi:hypothetical protein
MEKQWVDSIAFDAHASCEMGYHREETSKEVVERWKKGNDFVEIPEYLDPLTPAPGLKATSAAWAAAKRSGRAISEEDNLAAIGLGNREASLLGGYGNIVANLPMEKLARIQPLYPQHKVDSSVVCDTAVRAALSMHKVEHPAFGITRHESERSRCVVVVAATHGTGMSRIARRFRQSTVVRFDRLASQWCGEMAYNRNYDGSQPTEDTVRDCAGIVGMRLASGDRPSIKIVLTHEHPDIIVKRFQASGIRSHWYLYYPNEEARLERVQQRDLTPDIRRYMWAKWAALYRLAGYTDELRNEDEVIQLAIGAEAITAY